MNSLVVKTGKAKSTHYYLNDIVYHLNQLNANTPASTITPDGLIEILDGLDCAVAKGEEYNCIANAKSGKYEWCDSECDGLCLTDSDFEDIHVWDEEIKKFELERAKQLRKELAPEDYRAIVTLINEEKVA